MSGARDRVRAARRNDMPRLVDLRVHFLSEAAHLDARLRLGADVRARTEQMLPVWMGQDDRVLLVAESTEPPSDGGEPMLAGYAMGVLNMRPPLLQSQHVGEIQEVYLRPDERGKGVARALVAVLTDALCGRGADVLRAAVPVVNETALMRLRAEGYLPLQHILERRLDAV